MTFSGQFLLFSLVVLFAGMITIGLWVQREIRQVSIARTAEVTALYVDSFVAHHVQDLDDNTGLDGASARELDEHLKGTALGQGFVTVKLWARDGTILYSTNQELVGQAFRTDDDLRRAFGGEVVSRISDLSEPEHEQERLMADSLIETYAPIYLSGTAEAVAVVEFYQRPDALLSDIRSAQGRGWLIVAAATVVMYLMLVGLARHASRLIQSQRHELEDNVAWLSDLLTQNRALQERMRGAAGKVTALNERYLHRVSADLHDGPAQNVALAKMQVEALDNTTYSGSEVPDLTTIGSALGAALTDIRLISRGLRLPEIGNLSPADAARRAVRAFEQTSRTDVEIEFGDLPDHAPLSVKITLYRVLQEALANSYKHASGATCTVTMTATETDLALEIADDGPGFDPGATPRDGSLGLEGMSERVEVLGGSFEITSAAGQGTRVRVCLPLQGDVDD